MTFLHTVKSFIVSGTLGPKFCLGTVMPQAWLTTYSAKSIYLETLGCVVGALPVQMESIHGSSEDSDCYWGQNLLWPVPICELLI